MNKVIRFLAPTDADQLGVGDYVYAAGVVGMMAVFASVAIFGGG